MPSLQQLNDAVLAFMEEHPDALITVVVDAAHALAARHRRGAFRCRTILRVNQLQSAKAMALPVPASER